MDGGYDFNEEVKKADKLRSSVESKIRKDLGSFIELSEIFYVNDDTNENAIIDEGELDKIVEESRQRIIASRKIFEESIKTIEFERTPHKMTDDQHFFIAIEDSVKKDALHALKHIENKYLAIKFKKIQEKIQELEEEYEISPSYRKKIEIDRKKRLFLISLRNYRDVLSICRYSELMTVESLNTLNTERLITKTIDTKKHAIILVEASNVASEHSSYSVTCSTVYPKLGEEIAKGLLEEVEKNLSDARHELKNGEESVRRAAEDLAIATTAEETAEAEEYVRMVSLGVELSTAEIERRTAELLVMTPAAETLIKKHEEYKEAEKTHTRIEAALKAADESAQNVLAEITAELDRLRKTREESARAREYLELKLREGEEKIVSLEQKDSAEEERIRAEEDRKLAEEERAQELAAAPSAPAWSGYEAAAAPSAPLWGAPAAEMLPTAEAVPTAPEFVPAAEAEVVELHERTPLSPVETEKTRRRREESDLEAARAKAERAAEAERVLAEKEAEEEELAEDNWKPVTSDEAKRSARKRGGRAKTGKRHNRTRTGRAKPGKGRGKGVRKTRRSGDKSHTRKRRAA
jgi:Zn-finger nucleic acid-binding protein